MRLSRVLLFHALIICTMMSLSTGCGRKSAADERPVVSVTNSWLECAVKDVAGDRFRIVRLLPPGHCPGHFDLSPKQLSDIRTSTVLLRFHFQAGMDEAFGEAMPKGSEIVAINIGEGQCLPRTYLASADEVKEALSKHFPEDSEDFDANYAKLESRLNELSGKVKGLAEEAHLEDSAVLCSAHQAYFCKWTGLDLIAEFNDLNDVPPSAVNQVLEQTGDKEVDLVIGNLQGSPGFAKALAERFDTGIVVLSNFPSMDTNEDTFDKLVINNLEKLIEAVQE